MKLWPGPAFWLWFALLCFAAADLMGQAFPPRLPPVPPANPAQLRFTDVTQQLGIAFRHQPGLTSQKYILESMGGGVAVFDYDNDGRPDLFFVNGAPLHDPMKPGEVPEKVGPGSWNRLYHQERNGIFTDVTEKSGLAGTGYDLAVAVGDFDNNGFDDLYVTGFNGNHLYRNNGDGTFTDVTATAGVAGGGFSSAAAWLDYDNDGWLDLIVLRYLDWDFSVTTRCGTPERRDYCGPERFPPSTVTLYHNDGRGHFTDVTARAGLATLKIKGLGIDIGDYDRDGRIDIVLANDMWPQMLLRNKGDGTFEELGLSAGISADEDGHTFAGMGIDLADYDNDGWPDLLIDGLSFQRYSLFRNNGSGTFTYASSSTGVGAITTRLSGWGLRLADFDNDGRKDIFVAQSHVNDNIETAIPAIHYREPPLILLNTGSGFRNISQLAGAVFQESWDARGLAIGDLHNNGRLDVVISTNTGHAHVLRSDLGVQRHWLSLKLEGTRSNRDAIGATVMVATADSRHQYATVKTSASYFSSSDARLHFGLEAQTRAEKIEVRWPSGTVQTFAGIAADKSYVICETADEAFTPIERRLGDRSDQCVPWRQKPKGK